MGWRLGFGVGPLRYSTSLGGKRRRRRTTASQDSYGCATAMFMLCVVYPLWLTWWTVLASAWLLVVPVTGVIAACRKDAQFFKAHWYHPLEYWRFKR